MKVQTRQPIRFVSGDVLDPADLNEAFEDAARALHDVAEKRFQRSALVLSFVQDVSTPITGATTPAEMRTIRFRAPWTCHIERAEISANMTSSAEVTWTITATTGGTVPAGATVPWLSTLDAIPTPTEGETRKLVPSTDYVSATGAVLDDTIDVSDFNPDRVVLLADTEYQITVSSTAAFTLYRCDLLLWVTTDRFLFGSTDGAPNFFEGYDEIAGETSTYVPSSDITEADADVVTSNKNRLITQAAVLIAHKTAYVPLLFTRSNFTSGTDPKFLTFAVPRFDSSRAQGKAQYLYLWVIADAASSTSVTATLNSDAGATLATTTATFAASTYASGFGSGSGLFLPLTAATSGIIGAAGSDYSIVLSTTNPANIRRAYGLLWISR